MEWLAAMEIATRYWVKSPVSVAADDVLKRLKEKLSETSPDVSDSGYDDDDTAGSIDEMWTLEEDLRLKKWAVVFNLNWRRISNYMSGRTPAMCQKRWDGFQFPERFSRGESVGKPLIETREKLESEIRELCANNQDQCLHMPQACLQALQPTESEERYSYEKIVSTKNGEKTDETQGFPKGKSGWTL